MKLDVTKDELIEWLKDSDIQCVLASFITTMVRTYERTQWRHGDVGPQDRETRKS